jgi:hypothetical protein
MTIRYDKTIALRVSLAFRGFIWKQCLGSAKDADADPAPGIQFFISVRIRLLVSSFYLNADPDPWLQFLPQCGSSSGDPVLP